MAQGELVGSCLVAGSAEGAVLFTGEALSFWMGVDVATGLVIDRHHSLCGESVAGRVLVMPSSRGSCAGSLGILELIVAGVAPSAILFEHADGILSLGAIIADEVFGKSIPMVSVGVDGFTCLRSATHLSIADGVVVGDFDSPVNQLPNRPRRPVELTQADRMILGGAEGSARQTAMRIVVRLAEVLGACELVDVDQAHLDGCFYTGPAGLQFAETLAEQGGRVKVPSTTNAASVDIRRWKSHGADPTFAANAIRVGNAYVKMGARPSFTCAPYLLDSAPRAGQQIAWGESNAVAYANSVLGARTMKYPDMADVCVALTGRAPLIDAYLEAERLATVRIDVDDLGPVDDSFFPLLGYHVGSLVGYKVPVIAGVDMLGSSTDDLKAFSAAFATTSAAPMFHIIGVTPEAPTLAAATGTDAPVSVHIVSRDDLLRSWYELNTSTTPTVDLVSLGNPHFSLTEIAATVELCHGRSKHPDVEIVVTCGRDVHSLAEQAGHIAALEEFGAQVLNDTCWCMFDEAMLPDGVSTLITNSGKYAHYAPGISGRGVYFNTLEACVDTACTGLAPAGLPTWLSVVTRQ